MEHHSPMGNHSYTGLWCFGCTVCGYWEEDLGDPVPKPRTDRDRACIVVNITDLIIISGQRGPRRFVGQDGAILDLSTLRCWE